MHLQSWSTRVVLSATRAHEGSSSARFYAFPLKNPCDWRPPEKRVDTLTATSSAAGGAQLRRCVRPHGRTRCARRTVHAQPAPTLQLCVCLRATCGGRLVASSPRRQLEPRCAWARSSARSDDAFHFRPRALQPVNTARAAGLRERAESMLLGDGERPRALCAGSAASAVTNDLLIDARSSFGSRPGPRIATARSAAVCIRRRPQRPPRR